MATIANREFLDASIRYGARIGTTAVAVDTPLQSGRELSEVGSQAVFKLAPRSLLWLKADAGGHPESRDWSA
ncbi:hypothetical protein [Bosea sp. F3-2]|uniref:hypothetical protein n=1 Tax=Bosea sp. F3-2 TaxID=2599640 RepID=UPI001655D9CC|nr:hypothetical protein [Bosea sp. F3-2]